VEEFNDNKMLMNFKEDHLTIPKSFVYVIIFFFMWKENFGPGLEPMGGNKENYCIMPKGSYLNQSELRFTGNNSVVDLDARPSFRQNFLMGSARNSPFKNRRKTVNTIAKNPQIPLCDNYLDLDRKAESFKKKSQFPSSSRL
jgi:hypothetical protein